jgi:branched-chain amino acid transport system permease protein
MIGLTLTRWGRILRAVISDPCLAEVSGVNVERVILSTSFISSALAATGGILQVLDVDMIPTFGMPALLAGVVVAIVGGMGSLPGIAFGAVFLAMAQQLTMWRIGTMWQDVTAFGVLLIFIILRPQGFLGKPVRKGAI